MSTRSPEDDLARRVADARVLVDMLRARGDRVEAERQVVFELLVPGPMVDPVLLQQLRAEGFTVDGPRPPRLALFTPRRVLLRLEKRTPVDEVAAEAFTRTLVTLSGRHGGLFEQWLPEPVDQARVSRPWFRRRPR